MTDQLPPARVKHFCNPGDLVASLAAMKSYYEKRGRKIIFCQQLNVPANYYPGATHGTVSDFDSSTMVCMNKKIFDMVKPLVESQEYIHSMEEFTGQEDIVIDIDVIRKKVFVNLPHGAIQAWVVMAFPDLSFDLSKPWIILPEVDHPLIAAVQNKIVVNFTERYRNPHIHYYFLRKFKHRILFIGTEREHLLFTNRWQLDIPHLKVENFLDLAYAIKYSKFFMGNQSMCWNVADSLKTPRVLEMSEHAPNCIPMIGEYSYGFLHQEGVEHYVDILTC